MARESRPVGLIQRYREELQTRHYARRTVTAYEQWLRPDWPTHLTPRLSCDNQQLGLAWPWR
jgi:hypothetical protein